MIKRCEHCREARRNIHGDEPAMNDKHKVVGGNEMDRNARDGDRNRQEYSQMEQRMLADGVRRFQATSRYYYLAITTETKSFALAE